jgi:hypothetical protein
MKRKKFYKIIAVFLVLNLVTDIVSPTVALALTHGPSQPEMESFEPVGTTQMVDPFTGDFNYNIPLLTVPGPNGGYPINMSYHGGIGMDQEASWVGLGWNINAGEISRQMRGLPDDFNGDVVHKEMSMRPNRTLAIGFNLPIELWGLDLTKNLTGSYQLLWNNYKGVGMAMNLSLHTSAAKSNGDSKLFGGGVSLSNNSLSGTGSQLTASVSYTGDGNDRNGKYQLGATLSSLDGLKSLNLSASVDSYRSHALNTGDNGMNDETGQMQWDEHEKKTETHSNGSSIQFCASPFVPHSTFSTVGVNLATNFKYGGDGAGIFLFLPMSLSWSSSKYSQKAIDYNAYGYMHSEGRNIPATGDVNANCLMDFNRQKDVALSVDIPAMPSAMFTNDVYMVKGQGVGGNFRPYRSDIGVLSDPSVLSHEYGGSLGVEVGIGFPEHFGMDVTLFETKSYSGSWNHRDLWSDLQSQYQFTGENSHQPTYEPFYFREAGDMSTNMDDVNSRFGTGDPFPIDMVYGTRDWTTTDLDQILCPVVETRVNNRGQLNRNALQSRKSRSESMEFKTNDELNKYYGAGTFSMPKNIYDNGKFPRMETAQNTSFSKSYDPSGLSGTSSHIGEISVLNADGNRYVYALPAFNLKQTETCFSVDPTLPSNAVTDASEKTIGFNLVPDATPDNAKNLDQYYTRTNLPAYAHSYMLTAIYSPDYVDLTGNGPSDDDLGYYVKFNYSKAQNNYGWRAPYFDASYMPGFASTTTDDKAGYTYGEKEIWYLTSVETKTHTAEFILGGRQDGYGTTEGSTQSGHVYTDDQKLQYLDHIDLYSKSDQSYTTSTPVPIKTVHFDYTYDLCGHVMNNNGNSAGQGFFSGIDRNANKGKLTLKKVWFTYLNNNKGQLSPYVFDYHERTVGNAINQDENPDYSAFQTDRWGNYKPDRPINAALTLTPPLRTRDEPYVSQVMDVNNDGVINQADIDMRNNRVSSWSLKEITLPSGGRISVQYESDDYGFVQDKHANQMVRIIGTGPGSYTSYNLLDNEDLTVFFELNNPNIGDADVWPYLQGLDQIYFKVMENLKVKDIINRVPAYDYVEGYAELDGLVQSDKGSRYGVTNLFGTNVGYLKLKNVDVHDGGIFAGNDSKTHPFAKAGWQYMKLQRPDLLYPSSVANTSNNNTGVAAALQIGNAILGQFVADEQLLLGYYTSCNLNGYCHFILTDPKDANFKPSYMRLNCPTGTNSSIYSKGKYGGGTRVKQISISDTWQQTAPNGNEKESQYGQVYSYTLTDGTSSGVAAYEPFIGGEEIPQRQPIRYSSPYFIFKHKDLYLEEPLCEEYFPAPQVGYSRIVVKNIEQMDNETPQKPVTKTSSGITVQEFFTAKDFPTIVTPSSLLNKDFAHKIPIPFIGSVIFDDHGYSQRYLVENNDMHGKMKAVSTYSYFEDFNNPQTIPVSRVEYIYNLDNAYTSTASNHLNNQVTVLDADAVSRTANIGITREFFVDMREASSVAMTQGGQANMDLWIFEFFAIPYFFFLPVVDYSESNFKSVVAMDLVSRNGILMETRTFKEGSVSSCKNLMFDANTGNPLLTQVTNDFDNPVYTYNFAAHWAYDGMGNAYKNSRAVFDFSLDANLNFALANVPAGTLTSDYFVAGDEVLVSSTDAGANGRFIYWVSTIVDGAHLGLIDAAGNQPNPSATSGAHYTMRIMHSGRRNQQSVSDGKIVSLTDPTINRNAGGVLAVLNSLNAGVQLDGQLSPKPYPYAGCSTGSGANTAYIKPIVSGNSLIIYGPSKNPDGDYTCQASIIWPTGITPVADYHFTYIGNNQIWADPPMYTKPPSYLCQWSDPNKCFSVCDPQVLHAEALEFKDKWNYDYASIGNPVSDNGQLSSASARSPYRYGTSGIWRLQRTNLFQIDRKRTAEGGSISKTDISKDGTYNQFTLFNWAQNAPNPDWTWTSEVTRYSPYGFETENKDALGIFSSALYGYKNSLQTAVAANAGFYEIGCEGFEDYPQNIYTVGTNSGHGNLNLYNSSGGTTIPIATLYAHTGTASAEISPGQSITHVGSPFYFQPDVATYPSKKFVVSAWFRPDQNITPILTVTNASNVTTYTDGLKIEGWQKIEVTFTPTNTAPILSFSCSGSGLGRCFVDDIRVQPFNSTLKTYVYNPNTLWLMAELDNQNYATFYNYDNEGKLVQVKKETVNGIMTLKTSRSNVSQ